VRLGTATLFAAALLAAPASAQQVDSPIETIARELAFQRCPGVFKDGIMLTSEGSLTTLGFGSDVTYFTDARSGQGGYRTLVRPDGTLRFGGVRNRLCMVEVEGPAADKAAAAFRSGLPILSVTFAVDTRPLPPAPAGMSLDRRVGLVDGERILAIELGEGKGPPPTASYRLYGKKD